MALSVKPARITAIAAASAVVAGALIGLTPATPALAAGPADHVVYWNGVLLQAYRDVDLAPGPLTRNGAMTHIAMYDAANSVLCAQRAADCLGQQYAIKVNSTGDLNTAIDYAAYHTLRQVYPTLDFTDELNTAQMGIPDSAAKTAGISVGTQAANAVVANRANDGSGNTTPYTLDNVEGAWRPTDTRQAATPNWGRVRPFGIVSGSQFRPPLPGGAASYSDLLKSAEYAEAFNEVRELGAATNTTRTTHTRTPEQTRIAFFWANDVRGTYKPPGQLFDHTRIVAQQQGLSIESEVKLFAYVAIALADAAIVAWDAKYLSPVDLWRPETAIQRAANDSNPDTEADPDWRPLSVDVDGANFSPPFPAYISGHATFGYAWAETMAHWFGRDDIAFIATTDDPNARGVTRRMPSFSAAAEENGHSRIYLGVHFHFDADNANDPGTNTADYAVEHSLYYNQSGTELLFRHQPDADSATECDDLGRQLNNEHRWANYRCVWTERFVSYNLYVS